MYTEPIQKASVIGLDLLSQVPEEIKDALQCFFSDHPNPAETDMLLWRMFYHSVLYDQQRNGAVGVLEDYGELHDSLKKLLNRLRVFGSDLSACKST